MTPKEFLFANPALNKCTKDKIALYPTLEDAAIAHPLVALRDHGAVMPKVLFERCARLFPQAAIQFVPDRIGVAFKLELDAIVRGESCVRPDGFGTMEIAFPDNVVVLTVDMIQSCFTEETGGFNSDQAKLLGIPWPLSSGWMLRAAGNNILERDYMIALEIRGMGVGARKIYFAKHQ